LTWQHYHRRRLSIDLVERIVNARDKSTTITRAEGIFHERSEMKMKMDRVNVISCTHTRATSLLIFPNRLSSIHPASIQPSTQASLEQPEVTRKLIRSSRVSEFERPDRARCERGLICDPKGWIVRGRTWSDFNSLSFAWHPSISESFSPSWRRDDGFPGTVLLFRPLPVAFI